MNTYLLSATLVSCLITAAFSAHSAPAGIVEGLQMPAWVERNDTRLPLRLGMELQSGDNVISGKHSKVLLKLEEGSFVKMGENARIDFDKLQPPEKKSGVFNALMNVVKGAFRFTTSLTGANRRRSVDVRIGTFTAGIRGTDIWGRSNDEKDLVCLIEGQISVESEGTKFDMKDPLSFYVKPKNAPADPVGPVDAEQLKQWAEETELADGQGVIRQKGQYFINLMSVSDRLLAEQNQLRFSNAGYAVEIQPADIDGIQWYRLRITNLASKADADQLAEKIQQAFGLNSMWIDKS